MGLFGKPKPRPAPAPRSQLMDYTEMLTHFGLPTWVNTNTDGAFHVMWMPATTRVLEYKEKTFQTVELVNQGKSVAVMMNGKTIGNLDTRCLPIAVDALTQYGGTKAPAVLQHTSTGKSYTIKCPDRDWKPEA